MQKKQYLSILKVISSFAVVMIHVNSCYSFWNFSKSFTWISANVLQGVFSFAVLVFFMITGATLIDYRERYSTTEYFKKRTKKTLIPYVFWTIMFVLLAFGLGGIDKSTISLKWIITGFLSGNILFAYWFFIPLFVIYLIIPIISLIPKENRQKIFLYIIVIGLLFSTVLPLVFDLVGLKGSINIGYSTLGYLVFIFIGYYIDNYQISKRFRILSYVLGIVGLTWQILATHILSFRDGQLNRLFLEYLCIPNVLVSISIFIFFKHLNTEKIGDKLSKVINWFADTSFGVYLLHMFIVEILSKLNSMIVYSVDFSSLTFRIVGGILIYLITCLLVKLIKKVPILNKTIP